jgi:hypothetical protein
MWGKKDDSRGKNNERTKSWKKAMSKHPIFDLWEKITKGMRGYFAKLHSLNRKHPTRKPPAISKPITVGLFQANVEPPKSRPSKSIVIKPTSVAVPSQSIALIPTMSGVRGLCTSRKKRSSRNAIPDTGRLIQKIQRQEMNSVNRPPRTGPAPPATAQVIWRRPRYRLRSLIQLARQLTHGCIVETSG